LFDDDLDFLFIDNLLHVIFKKFTTSSVNRQGGAAITTCPCADSVLTWLYRCLPCSNKSFLISHLSKRLLRMGLFLKVSAISSLGIYIQQGPCTWAFGEKQAKDPVTGKDTFKLYQPVKIKRKNRQHSIIVS